MATDLEKTLKKAGYTALPLPRSKAGPTTIIAFRSGQLYVVRNAATCLPLAVTSDPSVDTIQFTREFKFAVNGVVDLLSRLFGIGKAKGELDVHKVRSATVQMGEISHETIQTGELVQHLLSMDDSPCLRDTLARDHLTIVAALKAGSFRFAFTSESGAAVKLSAEEASGLFKGEGAASVALTESGEVVVTAPAYVGVIVWNGGTLAKELERAKRPTIRAGLRELGNEVLLARALSPDQVIARQIMSLGIPAVHASRPSAGVRKRRR